MFYIVVLAAVVAAVLFAVKKRWDLLDRVMFGLITWAEREYGTGTGELKLAVVIEKLYAHIPAVMRLIISASQLQKMVEKVLAAAKVRWERNPTLIQQ